MDTPDQHQVGPWNFVWLILTAFATVLLAAVTGLRGFISAKFKKLGQMFSGSIDRDQYVRGIKRVAALHEAIEMFREEKVVDRWLIFVGSNCGSVPEPGKPYSVRCIHGWSVDVLKHPEKMYNFAMLPDLHYLHTIVELIEAQNGLVLRTSDLPEHALLKSCHKREGVFEAVQFPIKLSRTEFVFLSLAKYSGSFTKEELDSITMIVQRMRAVFD